MDNIVFLLYSSDTVLLRTICFIRTDLLFEWSADHLNLMYHYTVYLLCDIVIVASYRLYRYLTMDGTEIFRTDQIKWISYENMWQNNYTITLERIPYSIMIRCRRNNGPLINNGDYNWKLRLIDLICYAVINPLLKKEWIPISNFSIFLWLK